MAKKKFTRKQLAAQKLFAKRAKAGTLRKMKKKKSKKKAWKRGPLCFGSISEVAHYMHIKGYKVVKK